MFTHDSIHIKKKQTKSQNQLYPSSSNHNKLLKISQKLKYFEEESCGQLNILLLQKCEEDIGNESNDQRNEAFSAEYAKSLDMENRINKFFDDLNVNQTCPSKREEDFFLLKKQQILEIKQTILSNSKASHPEIESISAVTTTSVTNIGMPQLKSFNIQKIIADPDLSLKKFEIKERIKKRMLISQQAKLQQNNDINTQLSYTN